MKKRILAALLMAVMVVSMLPALGVTAYAENTKGPGDEYVSLPITIRDYAADGMLFEYNEENNSGPQNVGATVVQPALRITTKSGGGRFDASEQNGYVRYTATSDGTYLTYSIGGNRTRTSIRYCVMSFRTNSEVKAGSTPTIGHRWNNGASSDYKSFAENGYNKGLSASFYNQVTDLGGGNEAVSYVTFYPRIPSGKIIDIAYIAFFDNRTDAENYAKSAAGNNGKNYTGGNNMQFGLLMGNAETHDYSGQGVQNHMNSYLGIDTAINVNGNTYPNGVTYTLPNGARETILAGRTRIGLTQEDLGANKRIVYKEKTVDYLAWLLEKTLTVKESNGGNSYNFNYVMGTKAYNDNGTMKELAAVLRESIEGTGSYLEAKGKYDAGQLSDAKLCTTYYDAAYFLLHNTFEDSNGYGQTIDNYRDLRLMKRTAGDGSTYYCFNSAYNNTDYNYDGGYIANTGFVYDQIYSPGWSGISIPKLRFNPIGTRGYGINGSIYHELTGNESAEYYSSTNYNQTLEGHAQFVYYEDDNLYFTFTGDDDVYLFINGKLVLDLGGGHSISKVKINVNDVRDLCGLKDGKVYDFDFYYMERHGTAANFSIETNIKIVDPSMLTEKIAYQNGVNVGNYGFVDANQPVNYQFKLTNNGDAKIEELAFKDNAIGVSLSKDAISLNPATAITDLYASVVGKDGITKASYSAGELTEDGLKALLKNGLEIGDTISIFGFSYTIPTGSWSNDKFTNTVYTSALSKGDNASHKTLNGVASCTVQKQQFTYMGIHYYEWMGKGVTATKAELIEAVTKAGVTNPGTDIQLCGPNGKTDSTAVNENAEVTANGITYTGTKTGSDTYYYKVGNYGPVAVTIYSYDVADNIYVLDYSLPVELNGADFGLMVNDTLSLAENKHPTTASTLGITNGSAIENYGTFAYGADENLTSLKYTMNSFMNGEDSVKIRVQVLEDGADAVTTKTGVVMEETVKVVPANVVYYEDDFPGITYINTDKNGWAHYKTNDSEGNKQSADQDSPYGSDPNYQKDKGTTYTKLVLDTSDLNAYQQNVINYLNQQLGLIGGDSSNGSLSALEVKETADVMSFEFRGTGFEIVSRTTQEQYAVVSVKVERKNGDGTYTVVKQFPVITESKGGDLYQVPIISVTGMDAAEYKVTLKAAGSTETKTRILYIDGVRIYQPLEGLDYADYYNPDEVHAKFYEIKSLIGDGKAIYADITDTGDETRLVTGTTLIEGVDQLLDATEDVNQYLTLGPNNELYMNGGETNTFLAFYLYPIAGVADNARTIEVGAHRKASYEFSTDPVNLIYGSTADAVLSGTYYYTIESGTEQYYEIDPGNLIFDERNNRYLLLVGTNDIDNMYAALALTNLKVSGYTIGYAEQETRAAAAANAIENSPALSAFKVMQEHYKALAPQEPVEEPSEELVEEPTINEDLVIKSAVLRATKIVSGKNAMLTAKVSGDAVSVVVLDADGNAVEFKKVASNEKNGIVTFQAVWTVTGSRGDMLNFTVVVYDSNGLRSSNTVPITVTIK